jgi:hypothetical protein
MMSNRKFKIVEDSYYTDNGCDCCELVVINPKFRISSTDDIIFVD